MKWIDDIGRGDWLRERITDDGRGVPTVAGSGWEASARIPHPAEASGDGTAAGAAPEGWLEPRLLRSLASLLEAATSTPDDVTVGVWNGFARTREGSSTGRGIVMVEGDAPDAQPAPTAAERDALMERLLAEANARLRAGILPLGPAGTFLELPGREYLLGPATVRDLADLAEHDIDLSDGLQLIWPADHAWLVASDIDLDVTIVGGSAALIRRIVAHPDLPAIEVPEEDGSDRARVTGCGSR
ncbi:hypothetical protein [Frondihabitans sp. 762G35]|uniref:hypothetical protein n=1 Tax=Frondihabitans sp. 762G35 TaxID=1446794 RepID=UPI000F5048A3|nr:hypothetical protein [Frondihabitans sp. 762G35]